MSQIKIYAHKALIDKKRMLISDAIHQALITELAYPKEKKFQRFIPLQADNFIYPDDRSDEYLIIEISMFVGRSVNAKKSLIKRIYDNLFNYCEISSQDIEITIFETPKENWGIRGQNADDLVLNYRIDV